MKEQKLPLVLHGHSKPEINKKTPLAFNICYKKKRYQPKFSISFFGAKDGTQTRDPQLGRLMLYQLSYFRNFAFEKKF